MPDQGDAGRTREADRRLEKFVRVLIPIFVERTGEKVTVIRKLVAEADKERTSVVRLFPRLAKIILAERNVRGTCSMEMIDRAIRKIRLDLPDFG